MFLQGEDSFIEISLTLFIPGYINFIRPDGKKPLN